MSDDVLRRVELVRTGRLAFTARNARGGELSVGSGDEGEFTPVELLLTAIAACTGMDVDAITGKRATPLEFALEIASRKVRDADGNHLTDIELDFAVEFADDEGGRAAEQVLPNAIRRSHDRLCTVSRTVELGAPVTVRLRGREVDGGPA